MEALDGLLRLRLGILVVEAHGECFVSYLRMDLQFKLSEMFEES